MLQLVQRRTDQRGDDRERRAVRRAGHVELERVNELLDADRLGRREIARREHAAHVGVARAVGVDRERRQRRGLGPPERDLLDGGGLDLGDLDLLEDLLGDGILGDGDGDLLGIDTDRTISLTFVIGAALAAVAGLMFLLYYGVIDFFIGFVAGVKAFTAAVLGGIGSLPGAVLGGLAIGLIETFWSAYFSVQYKDVAAFSILVIVLIFLPTGLLGRSDVEKV